MTTSPLVSVIIVTWNSSRDIVACLEAVLRQSEKRLEVIVVDNNSTDRTPELIQPVSPAVKLIRESVNLGYAEANNRGICESSGRYVLLLNPDCFLQADFIEQLFQTMEDHPNLGSASGMLLNRDQQTIDSTGIQIRLARLSPIDRGEGQHVEQSDFSRDILGPSGAAGFYRRAALMWRRMASFWIGISLLIMRTWTLPGGCNSGDGDPVMFRQPGPRTIEKGPREKEMTFSGWVISTVTSSSSRIPR